MHTVLDHLGWGFIVVAAPLVVVTLCIVLIAFAALGARRPATRRHCLRVMAHLTQYVGVLRGGRR
ncbi:MAG TPA: hypothetical protein VJT31_22230 [Rugosimonospora sp.]|nr:hypothetical protein [Rugosimonospora sp.]